MKKLFITALLFLGLVACDKEPSGLDIEVGDAVTRTVVVSLDEATRAGSDKGFDLDNIATSDYELRYILEVYLEGRSNSRTVLYSTATEVSFPVALVPGRDYRIVAWADLVAKVDGERDMAANYDRCYDTSTAAGLRAIKLNSEWNAMDESRDAYAGYADVVDYGSTSDIGLTLTRPFAKLRVVTIDLTEATTAGKTPNTVEVAYQSVPTQYDAYNATASNPEAKSHSITLGDDYSDNSGEKTLLADYIFANESGHKLDFDITIKDGAATTIKEHKLRDISLARNSLTTIKGNLLVGGN